MLRTTNQRAQLLTAVRALQSGIKKAAENGHNIADDLGKIHLLKKSKTEVPEALKKYWKLEFDKSVPEDDIELLESKIIKECFAFASPKK